LKMKLDPMLDSLNQRVPITTHHKDKPLFKKELPIDLLKNLLSLDLHPQELQHNRQESPTLQADNNNNSVDMVCQEDPSNNNNRLHMKENTHH